MHELHLTGTCAAGGVVLSALKEGFYTRSLSRVMSLRGIRHFRVVLK